MNTLNTPLNQVVLALVASGHIDRTDVKSKSEDDILLLAADVIDGTETANIDDGDLNSSSGHFNDNATNDQNVDEDGDPILAADEMGLVGVGEDGWPIYEHQYTWTSATPETAHRLLKMVVGIQLAECFEDEDDEDEDGFDPRADFEDTEEDEEDEDDDDDFGIRPLSSYTNAALVQDMFRHMGMSMRSSLDIKKVYDSASKDHCKDKLQAEVCENYFAQDNASFAEFFAKHTFFIDYFYIEQIREIEMAESVAQLARRLYINSNVQVSIDSLRNVGFKKEAVSSMMQRNRRQVAWALNLDDVHGKYLKDARRQLGY